MAKVTLVLGSYSNKMAQVLLVGIVLYYVSIAESCVDMLVLDGNNCMNLVIHPTPCSDGTVHLPNNNYLTILYPVPGRPVVFKLHPDCNPVAMEMTTNGKNRWQSFSVISMCYR